MVLVSRNPQNSIRAHIGINQFKVQTMDILYIFDETCNVYLKVYYRKSDLLLYKYGGSLKIPSTISETCTILPSHLFCNIYRMKALKVNYEIFKVDNVRGGILDG